jgi:hypothetical protein
MASDKKFIRVAQYLVAKNGTTKYLKFEASPTANQETIDLVEKIKAAIGGDVMYINLFDNDFKMEYNVPDFVKGSVSVDVSSEAPKNTKSKPSKAKASNEEPNW